MHCHLDFAPDPAAAALACRAAGAAALSCTVDPRDYEAARAALDTPGLAQGNRVRVAAGLHPWWVADGSCGAAEVALACELAREGRFVGEVGLDFAPRREGTFDAQLAAFDRVCAAAAAGEGGKLLSIHAVRSAHAVLDVLERRGLLGSAHCVLHWFSGSGDELARAVRAGCWFSVGTRMLATKRGRAYARQVPADRLLLETDLPNDRGDRAGADAWLNDLAAVYDQLAQLLGQDAAEQACANGRALLA
jgi:TatD DNase family protein